MSERNLTVEINPAPIPNRKNFRNLQGLSYGRLTVIAFAGVTVVAKWYCKCNCGNPLYVIVTGSALTCGKSKSCGCIAREVIVRRSAKHGHAKRGMLTTTYHSWVGMVQRCTNASHKNFIQYGGRGIQVCERWLTFENFLADMGEKPARGMSIDRIDNDKGYFPENCRWATQKEQVRNSRRSIRVQHNGITASLIDHCERLGRSYTAVVQRINKLKWNVSRALDTPIKKIPY